MKPYHQITAEERYAVMALRVQGRRPAASARAFDRHRGSVGRSAGPSRDGISGSVHEWGLVDACLAQRWSPEQIAGRLRRDDVLTINHETIYRHVLANQRGGGTLYQHLRCAQKRRRKRYERTTVAVVSPGSR